MKLAGNPSTFLLMSFDQSAADTRKGFFCLLAFTNVNCRTNVTSKRTVRVEPWYSKIDDPAEFSVTPSQAVFHFESLSLVEGSRVGSPAVLHVVRMNSFCPAISEFCIK